MMMIWHHNTNLIDSSISSSILDNECL
jgi:hypothetical protein